MKIRKLFFSSLAVLSLALGPISETQNLQAQTTGSHTVTLTWTASLDGGIYTVYRATGVCSPTLTFTSLSVGITGTTYVDSGISPGRFCYQVTTVVNSAESLPSNQAQAVILPAPPTSLTVVVK